MAKWGKVYQLIEKASCIEVWQCISSLFLESSAWNDVPLPEGSPESFFCKNDGVTFSYHEDERWSFFNFVALKKEDTVRLHIIFDKDKQPQPKNQTVHNLYFFEETDGEHLHFCLDFFDLLKGKRLVSNKQTRSPVRKIEYSMAKFLDDCGLKIMFSDNREGRLLRQVGDMAERLWFLGAEFYTSDEIDFMRIWEDTDSRIREIKEELPPKLREQLDSKERRASMLDVHPEFEPLRQILSPTIAVLSDERVGKISINDTELDDKQLSQLTATLIETAYELDGESLTKEFEQKFAGFRSKYPEQDLERIRGAAEKAALFDASLKLSQQRILSRGRERLLPQTAPQEQAVPSIQPQDSTAGPQELGSESDPEIKRLQEENASLRSRIEELEREKERRLAEQGNKIEQLQEQLHKKEAARTNAQNETRNGVVILEIPCAEANLFPDEIEDFLHSLLYFAIEQERRNLPEDKKDEVSRKRDVIEVLLEGRTFNWEKSQTAQKLKEIKQLFKNSPDPSERELNGIGLTVASRNDNLVCYFYKERYIFALPQTSGDTTRGQENKMQGKGSLRERCFLTPPNS